jgi:hypothetical protein
VLGLSGALPALGVKLAHESDLLGRGMQLEGFELDVEAILETLLIQVHLQLYIRPIIQNTPPHTHSYLMSSLAQSKESGGPTLDGPAGLT